ncbi:MAG: acyl-CoA/acyl-ACP dehydrogenase [Armatimonadota bacterium]|nr:acyl-CoA/acyl-ACP dehydrogenase [Armatimonadota bacterium]
MVKKQTQRDDSADVVGLAAPPDGVVAAMAADTAILDSARRVGEKVLGPQAQESDRAPGPNPDCFRALAEAGLLGLSAPREYGGMDAPGSVQRECTRILASYCGVTTFVQAQHHGPCRMIAGAPNAMLRERLLPDLATGKMLCAVSFAHLRRPGPPVLRAEPVSNGYRLYGTAPWVTGWGLMKGVVFGATLPDGRFVYLWSPADRADFPELFSGKMPEGDGWGSLQSSKPLPLCAMNASATTELTLDGWFIPQDHWLSESDRETMRRNDRNGVLGGTAMPLGCIAASVRLLQETAGRRSIPAVARAAESFRREEEEARRAVEDWNGRGGQADFFLRALELRAWIIELAVRAAHAAVTANSGSANGLAHPAQRLLREAMFYTIQAQTQEVMDSTLTRLERKLHGS